MFTCVITISHFGFTEHWFQVHFSLMSSPGVLVNGYSYRPQAILQLALRAVRGPGWKARGWWTLGVVDQVTTKLFFVHAHWTFILYIGRYSQLIQQHKDGQWGIVLWQGFKRGTYKVFWWQWWYLRGKLAQAYWELYQWFCFMSKLSCRACG